MNYLLPILVVLAGGLSLAVRAESDDPAGSGSDVPWYSVDSGGTLFSPGGDFELSGTSGQWDATEAARLRGGRWRLSAGFWSLVPEETAGLLFGDRFEQVSRSPAVR